MCLWGFANTLHTLNTVHAAALIRRTGEQKTSYTINHFKNWNKEQISGNSDNLSDVPGAVHAFPTPENETSFLI